MAASIETKVKIDPPPAEIRKKLEQRRMKLADLKTPYAKASIFLDQWVQKNFKTEGGNVGNWVPFSPSTLAAIEISDPGRMPAKLLQKTGALRSSFLPFASARNAGIGSDIPYAKRHNEGAGNIPERRMLPKRREVIADVREIMKDHVKESIKP